jgi:hypothetical protein
MGREVEGAWAARRDRPRSSLTRGIVGLGLRRWTGNLDVDVIGAADSLTWDVMLVVMLIVVVVVVVVLLLSVWIGVGVVGYELLEEGDNRAMHQHQRHWDGAPRPVGTSVSARGKDYRSGDRVSPAHWTLAIMPGTPSSITRKGTALVTRCFRDMQRTYDKLRSILLCGHDVQASRCSFRRASRGNWLVQSIWGDCSDYGKSGSLLRHRFHGKSSADIH